jgi:Asp-tRNA(Asn)/Glu-tRNA(Gln) amidotransferase A subunit family amidase
MTATRDSENLYQLDAWDAASLLARREITAEALVRSCLERILDRQPLIHAFAYLNPKAAIKQAQALDAGGILGLLHGIPFGVKDLFDTQDAPTSYGTSIYAGYQPKMDAAAVAYCSAAGGVMMGKTVTTELANMQPTAYVESSHAVTTQHKERAVTTHNPHHLAHTPGGSSSGSAAAVADFMLPLALGTQTAGSLIRPAAFCGVVGFKPSHNRIAKAGVKSLSETLDTIGCFARSVRDVALMSSVLTGDIRIALQPCFADVPAFNANLDVALQCIRIGVCQTPEWRLVGADTQVTWALALRLLQNAKLSTLKLTAELSHLVALQKDIQAFETARSLFSENCQIPNRLSGPLQALLASGEMISSEQHDANLRTTYQARQQAQDLFSDVDVILAPSTVGAAPHGLAQTGDPLFCRTWTLLGLPCIHLPFTKAANGLPMGLQLVGAYGQDHKLLAAAHVVHAALNAPIRAH